MDNSFPRGLMELRYRNPATAPVSSKEDIVDRITDGFVPSKRIFRVYITRDGEFMSENEAIRQLADSVNAIYDEMTPEELTTFQEMLSHLYRKRCVQQRTTLLTAGSIALLGLVAWQVIKRLR